VKQLRRVFLGDETLKGFLVHSQHRLVAHQLRPRSVELAVLRANALEALVRAFRRVRHAVLPVLVPLVADAQDALLVPVVGLRDSVLEPVRGVARALVRVQGCLAEVLRVRPGSAPVLRHAVVPYLARLVLDRIPVRIRGSDVLQVVALCALARVDLETVVAGVAQAVGGFPARQADTVVDLAARVVRGVQRSPFLPVGAAAGRKRRRRKPPAGDHVRNRRRGCTGGLRIKHAQTADEAGYRVVAA